MGGDCSQKPCPGGECTPLPGAANLRIITLRKDRMPADSSLRAPLSPASRNAAVCLAPISQHRFL